MSLDSGLSHLEQIRHTLNYSYKYALLPQSAVVSIFPFYDNTYCSLAVKQNSMYVCTLYVRIKRQQGLQTTPY